MEKHNSYTLLADKLIDLLKAESYSKNTMKDMMFILNRFSEYAKEHNIEEYTPQIGAEMIEYCAKKCHVCQSRISRARGIVLKLNRLLKGKEGDSALWNNGEIALSLPDNLMNTLDRYIVFCRKNGNREPTLRYKKWICGRFLASLANLGCQDIANITDALVQKAFLSLGFMRYWERIGPFLRFLHDIGSVQRNYSQIVIHRKNHEPHPTVYSSTEISSVENSINRDTSSGKRTYAIMLLLSRYGIRACDIAALTFANVDFVNNRLMFVQQKTGKEWESEMLPDVKDALYDYINNARPTNCSSDNIFITCQIPYKPVKFGAINALIGSVFKKSGININEKRHGSRSLRSSAASNMINDNVPTEVVRRVLGHDTQYALRYYARIDIESMRICPLPSPEPSGLFAESLAWKDGDNRV